MKFATDTERLLRAARTARDRVELTGDRMGFAEADAERHAAPDAAAVSVAESKQAAKAVKARRK